MTQKNQLSNREWEVAKLVLEGKSNKLIASTLTISERTVEFHLKNIYDKFQVSSRVELILKLGNATGGLKAGKLGDSTVDNEGQAVEDSAKLSLRIRWATTLRDTFSAINKEINVNRSLDSHARDAATPMTFLQSIRVCLTKYAEFGGRATRSEFWWFALFVTLVVAALTYVSEALASTFLIAMLLPLLAAGTRRLRDGGNNAWWQLFLLVPVAGIIVLGFMWAQPSTGPRTDDPATA